MDGLILRNYPIMKRRVFVTLLLLGLSWMFSMAQTFPNRLVRKYTPRTVLNEPTHDDHPFHLGFSVGLNAMDASITSSDAYIYSTVQKLSPGFTISGVANLRINNYMDFRWLPGILFGSRKLVFFAIRNPYDLFPDYEFPGWDPTGETEGWMYTNQNNKLQAQYIESPLLVKFKSMRVSNIRPYVIGGMTPRYNLQRSYSETDEVYIDTKQVELFYEGGAGVDFYLPYFKLTLELRGSWGVGNALDKYSGTPDNRIYQGSIGRLRNSVYMFTIYFE